MSAAKTPAESLRVLLRCGAQPWEANFGIALDFCTFHTRRHPFPEPDAAAIHASYDALAERFNVAAQLDKRAALQTLLRRFKDAPLQCEAPVRFFMDACALRLSADARPNEQDGHARVLALLHALAGAPLRSPHDAAAFAAVLARLDGGAAEAEAAARRAAGRAPADAPPPAEEADDGRSDRAPSEADTLSDWSDDEDNQAAAAAAAAVRSLVSICNAAAHLKHLRRLLQSSRLLRLPPQPPPSQSAPLHPRRERWRALPPTPLQPTAASLPPLSRPGWARPAPPAARPKRRWRLRFPTPADRRWRKLLSPAPACARFAALQPCRPRKPSQPCACRTCRRARWQL
jgi:hypothetical protein